MDGEIYFQTWIPNFWPIGLLWATSIARKITEPKFHLFMFSLDNVVESLGELLYLSQQLKLRFFMQIIIDWVMLSGRG